MQRLTSVLAASGGEPAHWANDVRGALAALEEAKASGALYTLGELGAHVDEANPRAQRLLRRFGALLRSWPRIFEAARRLGGEERGLDLRP
ncbi:MAG: hypothetical protein NVS3B10_25090 [Polyangiales bacterium]